MQFESLENAVGRIKAEKRFGLAARMQVANKILQDLQAWCIKNRVSMGAPYRMVGGGDVGVLFDMTGDVFLFVGQANSENAKFRISVLALADTKEVEESPFSVANGTLSYSATVTSHMDIQGGYIDLKNINAWGKDIIPEQGEEALVDIYNAITARIDNVPF